MEARGRRVFPAAPDHSLLLLKATAQVPHGGGKKIEPGQPPLSPSAPLDRRGRPASAARRRPRWPIEVEPPQRVLALRGTQQLRVTAIDADGRRRCVTTEAEYDVQRADHRRRGPSRLDRGRHGPRRGGHPGALPGPRHRLPDHHAATRGPLRPSAGGQLHRPPRLGQARPPGHPPQRAWPTMPPSCAASSSTPSARCRPPPKPAPSWPSTDPDKRARLIDQLLERPEYADYWAMQLVRPAARGQGRRHAAGRRRHDALAAATVRRESALRRIRPRHRDGPGQHRGGRAGRVLQGAEHAGGDEPVGQPGVPGRAHRVRPVPSSPLGAMGPGRLLRPGRLLHRRPAQEAAGRRRGHLSPAAAPICNHPRTGKPGPGPAARGRAGGFHRRSADRRRRAGRLDDGAGQPILRPAPSPTGSGRTTSAAAWSSRSTTCAPPTPPPTSRCWPTWPSTCARRSTT